MNKLFTNISCLLSFDPLAKAKRAHSIEEKDLGLLRNAWIFCQSSKIKSIGTGVVPSSIRDKVQEEINLEGAFVMPGLVDAHTHTIYAGDRFTEFVQKINGSSYQEIANSGGGIQSTVRSTREASDTDLIQSTLHRIRSFEKKGVTTLEVKTGYGLSIKEELRLARLLKRISTQIESHIVATCLALHDKSPEFSDLKDYIQAAEEELLPILVKENLVSYVDAFVDKGYYTGPLIESFMLKAKKAGLGLRLHADEFSHAQGAHYAAKWGAASADHLQCASEEDAKSLAAAQTVAILLPGTSLYSGIPFADARKFIKAGCAVAIASDFNPGSSYTKNLAQLAVIGSIHCHLKSWEALAAVTYVPAFSLGLGSSKGAISVGFDADFLVYRMRGPEDWLASMGQQDPAQVWISAEQAH